MHIYTYMHTPPQKIVNDTKFYMEIQRISSLFNIEALTRVLKQEKEIKVMQIRMQEVKLSLLANDTFLHIEYLKENIHALKNS